MLGGPRPKVAVGGLLWLKVVLVVGTRVRVKFPRGRGMFADGRRKVSGALQKPLVRFVTRVVYVSTVGGGDDNSVNKGLLIN